VSHDFEVGTNVSCEETTVSPLTGLFFSMRYPKTDTARNTKLDVEMLHNDSWKSIYFVIKRSNVMKTRHKKQVFTSFRNTVLPLAEYISCACPATQAMPAPPVFPTPLSRSRSAADREFFGAWSFSQSASGIQSIARVGLCGWWIPVVINIMSAIFLTVD